MKSSRSSTPSKREAAAIYREAALLTESDGELHACRAIWAASGLTPKSWFLASASGTRNKKCAALEPFEAMFKPEGSFPLAWSLNWITSAVEYAAFHEHLSAYRTTALCFMAAIAERP